MRFLLVDDNQANLKILNAFLHKATDCETVLVNNIPEALFLTFTQKWNCIYLDIMMPLYNGNDYLRILEHVIKAKLLNWEPRIVVVTAIASLDELQSYTTIPFVSSVVRKPIQFEDVANTLQ